MAHIVDAALRPSTHKSYNHHWEAFISFCRSTFDASFSPPATPFQLNLFLTHLFKKGLQHATILNYTSAIAHYHRLLGVTDPTSAYVVTKFLQGVKNLRPQHQRLQPISINILRDLVLATSNSIAHDYNRVLFRAMMIIMYWACLRIGEVAISAHDDHVLSLSQVKATYLNNQPTALILSFKSFKHSKGAMPRIKLKAQQDTLVCPVAALLSYLQLRPQVTSPALFVRLPGVPVSRSFFLDNLQQALQLTAHKRLALNTHSFRIGRATDLALQGTSDIYIQRLGRWSSNAYKKYVRPYTISS